VGTRVRPELVVSDPYRSDRSSFAFKRRTPLQVWCGVFFLGFLVAGCGSATPSAETSTNATLTIEVPESTLNTADTGIRQPAQYLSQEPLTTVNVDGRAAPRLARAWAWENDGLTLRMTLSDGVRVHDGSLLTAATVADALRLVISNPDAHLSFRSFADVREVRATGENEIVFDLSRRSAYLPEDLDLPIAIGPNRLGTGPYRIVTQDATQIVLERFDDYRLGPAKIQRVVIESVPTLRTAWTSLLRAEAGMVTNVPPDAIEFVSNEDVQLMSFATPYQFAIGFNSQSPRLRSASVRRALNIAVDREALIARVFQGRGTPSIGPIWPQHWAYDTTIPGYTFDPGQAASLLDAAGLPLRTIDGRRERFAFTCLIPANFTVVERVALEVQKQLYDVGVNVKFEVVSIGEFTTRVGEGRFEAMLIDMVSGLGLNRSTLLWRQGRGLMASGYNNPEAQRLFTVLSETTNEAAIRSATSRLQRVLIEDPPALFIAWTQRSRAVRRQFQVVEEPGRDPLYTIPLWTSSAQPIPVGD
jgi:peptide/nickel transport system substrate-binding protein